MDATAQPTREVILDTAEQLFAARGVDSVTMRDLAHHLDLTAPSLYNHFAGKQALYDAVLERGLRPLIDILVDAWAPGALEPERMRATLDRVLSHLAQHPHLGRLLQRALLGESGGLHPLLARRVGPVYREGLAVINASAADAGWSPEDLPYLAFGLFGLMFSYFVNTAALREIAATGDDPLAPQALAGQRRFLEKAVYRLLGPQPAAAAGVRRRGQPAVPS
ncbi:TetR/AcrR family transcriptional regulator [Candidatus Binatia bacterium]|nr:TetR/AcrR family transcriptional regulator [Candidatus Binatia bacterium]